MKTYTAWTQKNNNQEVITECMCKSAKEFKRIIESKGAVITSIIRIKK